MTPPDLPANTTIDIAALAVNHAGLRWRCDPDWLPFQSTEKVEPEWGVMGQDDAIEALRFGLEINAPGQNVYVRGLQGSGRLTLVRRLLEEISPGCPPACDHLYVHNFKDNDRPQLLSLPRGRGRHFKKLVDQLVEAIREDLPQGLNSEAMRTRRRLKEQDFDKDTEEKSEAFDLELKGAGLSLVQIQTPQGPQTAMVPLVEDQPVPPEQIDALKAEGKISEEQLSAIQEALKTFADRFQALGRELTEIARNKRKALRDFYVEESREILDGFARPIRNEFAGFGRVEEFVQNLIDDLASDRLRELEEDPSFLEQYRVNLIQSHDESARCPIIVENTPILHNLLGSIDREVSPQGQTRSDHHMISAGSLLRADGGYLILEARELLADMGAWRMLMRTLRTGLLEIIPQEVKNHPVFGSSLKPQPIPVNVKVVLIGDPGLYYLLDQKDADFPQLFKVLADFDSEIPRDKKGAHTYAGVFSRIAKEEGLLPFSKDGIAALVEHGARVAARAGRLTTRFGRLADIAREAVFLARKEDAKLCSGDHIDQAVERTKARADLPSRKFRRFVADGILQVDTRGQVVGQVNGLATLGAGPLTYGFPARITATIGPGSAGAINIEDVARLSGAIHTKGFAILGGLLRYLLHTEHPLAFSASIAFEQSYGGIDGDSASGAEMCCMLSALTGVPLRQDLAMTGAIDQHGHVQAIGAVNEKIEGFFDACMDAGMTGTQGVVVPRSNVGDLMLRQDIVEACDRGEFRVYGVATIHEALSVLTGVEVGTWDVTEQDYPEESLLGLARTRAREYWNMARLGRSDERVLDKLEELEELVGPEEEEEGDDFA